MVKLCVSSKEAPHRSIALADGHLLYQRRPCTFGSPLSVRWKFSGVFRCHGWRREKVNCFFRNGSVSSAPGTRHVEESVCCQSNTEQVRCVCVRVCVQACHGVTTAAEVSLVLYDLKHAVKKLGHTNQQQSVSDNVPRASFRHRQSKTFGP